MAIRFEPNCNEKRQWHVPVAGNLYSSPDQNSRQVSMNSPLDLRCHEASDYDRRTNSCSPDSCDLLNDKSSFQPVRAAMDFETTALHNPHKNICIRPDLSLASDLKSLPGYTNDFVPRENFRQVQRSRTVSDVEDINNHHKQIHAYKLKRNQERKSVNDYNSSQRSNAATKADFSHFPILQKQNGGSLSVRAVENSKCDHKRFKTSGHVDKNLKIAATSANVKGKVSEDAIKSERRRHYHAGFGETDAAEALLGLSEGGFYQTIQSPDASCNYVSDKQFSPADKNVQTATAKTASAKHTSPKTFDDSKTVHTSSEPKETVTIERKHFKKLICQKFVNSVQPAKTEHLLPPSKNEQVQENSMSPNEVTPNLKQSKKNATDSAQVDKKEVSTPAAVNIEQRTNTLEAKQFLFKSDDSLSKSPQINSEKSRAINHSLTPLDETRKSATEKHQQQLSTPAKTDQECEPNNKKKQQSNLYRISKSLGSSNESLAESTEDIVDDQDSESSSDSSDEDELSEIDDEKPSFAVEKDKSVAKEKALCPDFCKRKMFALSQPSFSVSWDKSIKQSGDQFSFGANKMDQNNHKNAFCQSKQARNSNETTTQSTLNQPRSLFGNAVNSNVEPSKQSGIHIKKATFTFSSAGKLDKPSEQSGLAVTSQAAAVLDRTQCASKDRNSFSFDRDKLDSNEATRVKQAASPNESFSTGRATFGTFRNGDSFETLSKPTSIGTNFSEINMQKTHDTPDKSNKQPDDLPYDKHRLPRPSARSAQLEAQQIVKSKTGRKRKLLSLRNNGKENSKSLQKPLLKRSKRVAESSKKPKSRHHRKLVTQVNSDKEKTCEQKQNGEQEVETNKQSAQLSLERSSSRRKPSRVYKHQKYTSVSMMSSTNSARDSSEFSIISKPLNLDHRMLLANSIDLYRGSADSLSINSNVSSPMTSSSCSSTTSSVAGDDNDEDLVNKGENANPDKDTDRLKRHRHLSAIETNSKSDFARRKHKMKRLMSMNDQVSRKNSMRLMTSNVLANSNWNRGLPRKGEGSTFRLLSLFPAPASLRPGYAHGELLPGYGPSVSGQRSSLPLRWTKGSDESDLKKKRQHQRWRNMTLDMFCMGAKS